MAEPTGQVGEYNFTTFTQTALIRRGLLERYGIRAESEGAIGAGGGGGRLSEVAYRSEILH